MTDLAADAAFGRGAPGFCLSYRSLANGGNMISMLQFDQSTIANMTAALEYVCRKLLSDKDNPTIRKYIAGEILAAAIKGQTSHGDLTGVGLKALNSYLFPPTRSWLKILGG